MSARALLTSSHVFGTWYVVLFKTFESQQNITKDTTDRVKYVTPLKSLCQNQNIFLCLIEHITNAEKVMENSFEGRFKVSQINHVCRITARVW